MVASQVNEPRPGRIKCVVWDLDNTVWSGVLLEDDRVVVRDEIVAAIRALDERGILNSIASRNDPDLAMARLTEAGLADMFLYPQIGWQPKSKSVAEIATLINIGMDTIAFVDDQPFELEEVTFALPDVLAVPEDQVVEWVANRPEFFPRFITDESKTRRHLYQADATRKSVEADFAGTSEEFLSTLDMVFTIWPADSGDLQRAEELTVRTHQLNSTGRTYTYEQLDELRERDDHLLLMSSLEDRFGGYGTIGLSLVEKGDTEWTIRLLLMSCRVVSRGVGTVMLNHIISLAGAAGVPLRGEFVDNGRNRMMYVSYKFSGFQEVVRDGDRVVLELPPGAGRPAPDYLKLVIR